MKQYRITTEKGRIFLVMGEDAIVAIRKLIPYLVSGDYPIDCEGVTHA